MQFCLLVGSKVAYYDLNPCWSDDEDGDAKTSMVVAVDKQKVEIGNGVLLISTGPVLAFRPLVNIAIMLNISQPRHW
uniref:Uncharacterized protein n=1 Tax=Ditylenchus dipsaci TaxID=166011 RepID=A0A915D6D2_9BILA